MLSKHNTKMESNEHNNVQSIDHQIKSDYDFIMKDCPNLIPSQWEMVGENYRQFSLYDFYYETRVINSVK